ncbi:MAG: beta-ketoacyl-[acyl-carrier-protein] synthase family protein [Polyangiaceae bacterium]|nr:beta-ketoacyl-[acyl-carrier-protein] synthase family protein [Polyangiaceae bacterium]
MSINTPLGDTLDGFIEGLLAGRSALSNWKKFDTSRIYSKVGADLSGYDIDAKVRSFEGRLPAEMYKRLRRLVSKAPWSTKLSMLLTTDAWLDAGLASVEFDATLTGVMLAGHNVNSNYSDENRDQFREEPDYVDAWLALHALDTDHASSVSELVGAKGPLTTMGAACASGNVALRYAIDEIRHHGNERFLIVGAVLDMSPMDLHAMALLGAISYEHFHDEPTRASRPFDTHREGFVPAHGGAVLVVEDLEVARRRGARIYAEVLGSESNADANHLPNPSEDGQTRLMQRLLDQTGVRPDQIDYVSMHATSTPLGDLTEARSIRNVFGERAKRLKVNATKSMLGHTCWAAATVEAVAAILQMRAGKLHPSINIDELDPEVELDVCRGNTAVPHDVRYFMKNSFGFGGINCVSLFKRYEG